MQGNDPWVGTQKELLDEMQKVANKIVVLNDEQSYMLRRVDRHRQTADSTHRRVAWWSTFQLLLLLAVCGFQIYYLRRFFESTNQRSRLV